MRSLDGFLQDDHVDALLVEVGQNVIQRYPFVVAQTLCGIPAPCMVDQDLPHDMSGRDQQAPSVFDPVNGMALNQPQNCLIDKCTGLQGVIGPLPVHQTHSQCVQMSVNRLEQPVLRPGSVSPSRFEEGSQVVQPVILQARLPPFINSVRVNIVNFRMSLWKKSTQFSMRLLAIQGPQTGLRSPGFAAAVRCALKFFLAVRDTNRF